MAVYSDRHSFSRKGSVDTKVFFYQGHISSLIPMSPRVLVLAEQAKEGLS